MCVCIFIFAGVCTLVFLLMFVCTYVASEKHARREAILKRKQFMFGVHVNGRTFRKKGGLRFRSPSWCIFVYVN